MRATSRSSRHHIVIVPVRALKTGIPEGVPISSAFSTKFVPSTLGQWIRTEDMPFFELASLSVVVARVPDAADGLGPLGACAQRAVGELPAAPPKSRLSSEFPALNAGGLSPGWAPIGLPAAS